MKSTRKTTIVALAVAALLAVCATTAAARSDAKTVTISVASLIPGSTDAAQQQFAAQVAQFEKAYVIRLMNEAEGNVSRAARLGRMDRSYLIDLLHRYGLKG